MLDVDVKTFVCSLELSERFLNVGLVVMVLISFCGPATLAVETVALNSLKDIMLKESFQKQLQQNFKQNMTKKYGLFYKKK